MNQITPYLYLGDCYDAQNLIQLKKAEITHILIVAAELEPIFPKNFTYLKINASDMNEFNLSEYFDQMADFIQNSIKQKGVAFVHCAVGVSRSPSAVIAYLIKYQKMGFKKALKYVIDKRKIVSPNDGFQKQLELFAQKLRTQQTTQKQNMIVLTNQNEEKKSSDKQAYYCKKCKTKLFEQQDLILHQEMQIPCQKLYLNRQQYEEQKYYRCQICYTNLGKFEQKGDFCTCGNFVKGPMCIVSKNKFFKI